VALASMGLAVLAYQTSPRLHDRVSMVASEYRAWQPDHGKDNSTGQRLDFYYNTLQIIRQQPVLGVGTGGFPAAFTQQTQGKDVQQTNNPHNEYLMIAAQAGVVGLALLLYLFYTQWRTAPRLETPFAQDAARGLVLAYLINSMFNSPLLDHADGLFFAFMTAVLFAHPGLATGAAEKVSRHD
jgi:O-antigen ligase